MLTMKTNSNHFQLFFPPRASKKIKTVIFNFEFFDFFARNVETAQEKDTTKNEFLRKIKKFLIRDDVFSHLQHPLRVFDVMASDVALQPKGGSF